MTTIEHLARDYPHLLDGKHKETEADLDAVESTLGIRLPYDVRWLLLQHGYGSVNAIPNIRNSVEQTLRFRSAAGLPHRYVVLDEMGDAGVVVLDCDSGEVVWADWRVAGQLDGELPANTADRFETFAIWVEGRIADLSDE